MQAKPKVRFYTERNSFGTSAGVMLLILSIFFRAIAYWGRWQTMDQTNLIIYLALPMASALLFIFCLLVLGRVALWSTAVPLLMGVAFFIIKAFTFESTVHTVLCVLLYVLIAVLWCGTVFNLIRTKWLLPELFLLPFIYHIAVEDLPALQNTAQPVTFAAGMEEMSILCIMLALFFVSLAIRKRYKETPEVELPPIKDPVVIAPEQQAAAQAAAASAGSGPLPGEGVSAAAAATVSGTPRRDPISSNLESQNSNLGPQPEAKPWAYTPEPQPEPEPEPDPEPASPVSPEPQPEAEAKPGLFGKLFHKADKPWDDAETEVPAAKPVEPTSPAQPEEVPEPVNLDDLPPAQGLTLDPNLEEAFRASDDA